MNRTDQGTDPRLLHCLALIDAANARDPNLEAGQPKELLYGRRMSEMLSRFAPEAAADPGIALAVRAQHIERWTVPRNGYPMTREGYHRWRGGLYRYHADRAAALVREAGYDAAMADRVAAAVGKVGLRSNPDSQLVEDVAGLVFIEHYMQDFAASKPDYDEAKWLGILRKTWAKLSERARAFALSGALRLPEPLLPLIQKAIGAEA